jgi:hypothetical protein
MELRKLGNLLIEASNVGIENERLKRDIANVKKEFEESNLRREISNLKVQIHALESDNNSVTQNSYTNKEPAIKNTSPTCFKYNLIYQKIGSGSLYFLFILCFYLLRISIYSIYSKNIFLFILLKYISIYSIKIYFYLLF